MTGCFLKFYVAENRRHHAEFECERDRGCALASDWLERRTATDARRV